MVAALMLVFGIVTWVAPAPVSGASVDQKPKQKKGGKKEPGRGPSKPVPAPKAAPVAGRSYDEIIAQNGPPRRRAWAPRPILASGNDALLGVVRGIVHTSVDGGTTWKVLGSIGVSGDEAVAFGFDGNGVWTCVLRSGAVAVSRDGCVSWAPVADLSPLSDISGPRAVEAAGIGANGGWAVIRGWSEPFPTSALLVGDANGWRLGAHLNGPAIAAWRSDRMFAAILGTTVVVGGPDGSDASKMSTLSGASLNDITFSNPTQAWIAADGGLVIESRDGGRTWLPRPVLPGMDLDAIGSAPAGATWVVGRSGARESLCVNQPGRLEWKVALQSVAPLSRPFWHGSSEIVILDGAGAVWTAKDVAGPWRKRGSLAPSSPGMPS